MFGCFRTIGCLVVALALAVVAFFTRDVWLPRVTGTRPDSGVVWERVTDEQRTEARRAVESLSRRTGPVFANLTAADASSLVLGELRSRYPAVVGAGEAAIVGNALTLRADVDLSQLKGLDALGPLAGALDSRQRVTFTGDVDVLTPGTAQFRVRDVKVGDVRVPRPMIPRLIAQLDRSARPASAAADALVFPIPPYVGDIRIANGRVTLYKSVK
jgi:hypothetical protein